MIKAICFDLDGTLLPMDIDVFCQRYFGMLADKMVLYGYEKRAFIAAIMQGSRAMYQNDGTRTNEQAFWDSFAESLGEGVRAHQCVFDAFYEKEFDLVREVCGFDANAARVVKTCKERGFTVAIATNPLFPRIATHKRLTWAGIDPQSVAFYTTYEDTHYCKPNERYYEEVAARLGVAPCECVMVGNDVTEDMAARKAGMHVFLLTGENLINRAGEDVTKYPHGSFDDLLQYIDTL